MGSAAGIGAGIIGVDWGTTSFRAALMDGTGAILDRITGKQGLLGVENRDFEGVLERALAGWDADRTLSVVASGMVTSRTGWLETPYLPCPAGPAELAAALSRFDTKGGRRIAFVTGMSFRHADGAPDVMRGEETQIAGLGIAGERLAVMPGTHSKWVSVSGGRIIGFRTAMTGDVFAAVKDHTVLKLTTAESTGSTEAFAAGVRTGAADDGAGLLGKLFRQRAGSLLGDFPANETAERLSGLLIGAEIAEARSFAPGVGGPVLIVGGEELAARYRAAFEALGMASEVAAPDAAFAGQFRIAKAAGLV
ncbi:MAG: 2-dehydro-3-deoxygalactonokinase [Phreatobacter sp.]|uniref:2-dehydro-3-deoxygalactonokinase n=1 Tax=Phreatobacter sp. TaxID=1966341 RepID=UPI001A3EF78B|nr:2-dehydro-3-deoxygalactonokinase [Phreatobacter sp.]MBL8569245.1 2-dehydro-3-deoxygalactonokinase [Phreatobacter sp.]